MKRQKTFLTLTILAAMLPAFAHAEDDRQVWRDSEAQIVHNTWGNCVRSIWPIDHDPCAPPPAVAFVPQPPRTVIAEADRTVYFPFNKADLTDDARSRLDSLAQRITSASDVEGASVVGYADRIGTASYNEALSQKRALNVSNYLINRGVIDSNVAQTRWVGKSESNTQCQPNLTHDQLVQCLAPDRKVTVELKYKTQEVTQPQTNAAPLPEQNPPQDWTGQASAEQAQPQPQSNTDDWISQNTTGQLLQPQQSVQPQQPPGDQTKVNPSVETYPLQQSSADQYQTQEPESQPNSSSPATYTTQTSTSGGQYAQEEYRQQYPAQPSDEYRQRYLTTGE